MADLVFEYGVMNSGKTISLLKEAYNYEKVGKNVIVFAPAKDTRGKIGVISTENGWKREAIVVNEKFNIKNYICNLQEKPDVIFVDESQFFIEEQIYDLAYIANVINIPVFCYGLLTDFRCELFEGSNALLKCASTLKNITTICECGEKATVNMRVVNGEVVMSGEQVVIGRVGSMYYPVCYSCYRKYCNKEKILPQKYRKII